MDKARDRMRRTRLSERGTGGSKPVPPRGSGQQGGPDQQRWMTVAWIVGGLVLVMLFQSVFGPQTEEISFTRLFELAEDGKIAEASVSETSVSGTIEERGEDPRQLTTTIPPNYVANAIVGRLE
ncbi:MAG TPA: ATP-dependent metallopeptidase FtsH/Yme1/Tma family protein, partial [Actinomycetota bacterium]|nr:ATP-dependent metallopeptidase FtsH/Yme1/Tma family protein [Actinomycetota bacterium]